ncbi:MAG: hypothetical protein OXI29_13355, partial [bacterium]|nr:hypothetical protein [bacterium]
MHWEHYRGNESDAFVDCLSGDGAGKAACILEKDLYLFWPDRWTINLRTRDDRVDEPDGTLTTVIEHGEGLTSNSVTVVIRDNDPTVVSLARKGSEVIAAGGAAAFTVTLGRSLVAGEVIDVPLAVSGPGVSASGYTLSVSGGTGATLSGTGTLTPVLRLSGTGAKEAALELRPAPGSAVERYRVALGPDGAGANGFDRPGLGTNVGGGADPHATANGFHAWKDLGNPSVTVTGGPPVTEGGAATFALAAVPAPSTPLAVTVEVTGSGDFAAGGQTGSRTVAIGTGGTGTLTVKTVDDSTGELDGTLSAAVQVGDGYTVGAPASATVAVLNDDVPSVSVAADRGCVTEGAAAGFTLTASHLPSVPVAVTVDVTVDGRFAADGEAGPRTVTVGTNGKGRFTVATVDDSVAETDGRIVAAVQGGGGYTAGAPSRAFTCLRDNDVRPPGIALHGPASGITEGAHGEFAVVATPLAKESLPVALKLTRTGDFMVSHQPGEPGQGSYDIWLQGDGAGKGAFAHRHDLKGVGSWHFPFETRDDGVDEPDGTLEAVVMHGEGLASNTVTVPVRDNDPTVVSLVRTGTGTAGAAAFTVTLGRALVAGETVDVPLAISGTGVTADGHTLSVTGGTGATLSGTGTLTPVLSLSGAGAQAVTLELVPAAGSAATRYTVALGPDGTGANGFDRAGLGTNVGGGADPHPTQNGFDAEPGTADPSVSVTGGPAVTEGGTATFTVTARPAPAAPLTVNFEVTDGDGFAADGQVGPRTVTVGTDGTGSLAVATVNDGVDGWTGAVAATLQAGDGYTVSSPSSAAVAVLNDGVQMPDYTVSVASRSGRPEVTEGTRFSFQVIPSWRVDRHVPATLRITQTGDFMASSGLAAWFGDIGKVASLIYNVNTRNDGVDEPDGSVTAFAEYGNGRTTNRATVRIRDDDPTVAALSRSGSEPAVAGSAVTFTVTLGRALVAGETIDVPLAISGTGVSADGFTLTVTGGTGASLSGTGTLTPVLAFSGAGAQTATLALVPALDGIATLYRVALGPDGPVVNGFDRPGLGTNVGGGADPDATRNRFDVEVTAASLDAEPVVPEVGIALAAGGTEGAAVLFVLSADPPPAAPLDVALTVTQEGDHVAAEDLGRRTVTMPASGSVTVTVPTVDDGTDEPDGTVTATLEAGSGYSLGAFRAMAVDVADNDGPPPAQAAAEAAEPVTVSLSADRSAIAEANGRTRFRIELDRALAAGEVVLVPFTISGGRKDRDWKVLFRDGRSGPGVKRTATGRKSAVRFTRGGRVATFVLVALPNEDTEDRTVTVAFGTGARTPRAAGVAGGIALAGGPLSVAIIDDDLVEPEVSVSGGSAVTEGGAASFTLSADPAPASDLAVTVDIGANGGAVAPSAMGERTVTLPGGTGSQTFTVATVDDAADGTGGAVTATVVRQDGYAVDKENGGATATVAVADDDATAVTLSAPSGDVPEAGGGSTLTVTLGRALVQGERLTVPLVFGGTATLGTDYTLSAPETVPQGVAYANLASTDKTNPPALTFTGPSAASATVILTATADSAAEGESEMVTVGLGTLAATGLGGGAAGSGNVSLSILEPPPEISIAAKTASVTEGADAAFTVTASRAPASDLTAKLTVSEADGSDFLAADNEGAATVTIPKGKTEAAFTVATVDDNADEPDGTVTATLAANGGAYTVAAAPGGAASVKVADNDAASALPTLSVDDATAPESDRVIRFTVRLSKAAGKPVWVSYRTRESTPASARKGEDWHDLGSGVRFGPEDTERKVEVYVVDDGHDEGPETFELVLTHAQGVAIADGVAVGTITNDDPMPAAWLSRFGRTVAEQALDGVAARMAAPRAPGLDATLAGHAVGRGGADEARMTPSERKAAKAEREAERAMAEIARALVADADPADPFGDSVAGLEARES